VSESSVSPFSSAAPMLAPVGARSRPRAEFGPMSGFLVVDVRGRVVGRVERSPRSDPGQAAGALSIRFGLLRVRRCLLPPDSIAQIDGRSQVIGLHIDRKLLRAGRS
jgi:hypothetical protein